MKTTAATPPAAVIIIVYGRVQGVGFRYNTRYQALQLGLTGYVRNLEDGSVEIVACGDQQLLQKLQDWIAADGATGSRVDRLSCRPYTLSTPFSGFSVRY